MKTKANFLYKPSSHQMDDCQIEKVVELSKEEFSKLVVTPLEDQKFIEKNKNYMFNKNGIMHCMLALGQGSNDGVLIQSSGYNYPRYSAYMPGMRDIVNAEMDRAADHIIRQGVENTTNGNWCVYFEELEKQLGLTVQVGNGLDSMLKTALKRRPEVVAVDMHDGCIEMEYHPEYCRRFCDNSEHELPELRVKDILPILNDGLIFLCHEEAERSVLADHLRQLSETGQRDYAALLNAHVSEINNLPDGVEVVLTDVEPEELVRFNEEFNSFMEAEQTTGHVMGGLT